MLLRGRGRGGPRFPRRSHSERVRLATTRGRGLHRPHRGRGGGGGVRSWARGPTIRRLRVGGAEAELKFWKFFLLLPDAVSGRTLQVKGLWSSWNGRRVERLAAFEREPAGPPRSSPHPPGPVAQACPAPPRPAPPTRPDFRDCWGKGRRPSLQPAAWTGSGLAGEALLDLHSLGPR